MPNVYKIPNVSRPCISVKIQNSTSFEGTLNFDLQNYYDLILTRKPKYFENQTNKIGMLLFYNSSYANWYYQAKAMFKEVMSTRPDLEILNHMIHISVKIKFRLIGI